MRAVKLPGFAGDDPATALEGFEPGWADWPLPVPSSLYFRVAVTVPPERWEQGWHRGTDSRALQRGALRPGWQGSCSQRGRAGKWVFALSKNGGASGNDKKWIIVV